ncbi:hypothetical protein BT63DRAFT_280434 [Microthyrium microscopicum]|uniref:Uncharacterized protein n=1 Tax=Microthyrium microscopicum TaxID=703497 RepID=A0A6A6UAE1_9PEZI|nr:hypothetical protein BT63DRAFT_280434 [Microthyrium microscopicum]
MAFTSLQSSFKAWLYLHWLPVMFVCSNVVLPLVVKKGKSRIPQHKSALKLLSS